MLGVLCRQILMVWRWRVEEFQLTPASVWLGCETLPGERFGGFRRLGWFQFDVADVGVFWCVGADAECVFDG